MTGYNVMEVAEAAFLYSKLFEEEAMLVLHKCARYLWARTTAPGQDVPFGYFRVRVRQAVGLLPTLLPSIALPPVGQDNCAHFPFQVKMSVHCGLRQF